QRHCRHLSLRLNQSLLQHLLKAEAVERARWRSDTSQRIERSQSARAYTTPPRPAPSGCAAGRTARCDAAECRSTRQALPREAWLALHVALEQHDAWATQRAYAHAAQVQDQARQAVQDAD